MLSVRKKRFCFLLFLILSIGSACGLALFALRQNVNLYYTPEQILQHPLSNQQLFRIGGMVVAGSVQHGADLQVSFLLTDYKANIKVEYKGILPALFREGQGIVAQGRINSQGIFIADQVLAKHDASYKPPGIKK